MTALYDIPLTTLAGAPATLGDFRGEVLLVVNVASKCGFTPQYTGLQRLYETYHDRGFEVLGFPCNQFLFQERGSSEEIAAFCSMSYGVTFPMFEKLQVKGRSQHPLYAELSRATTDKGKGGNVRWNFEKFLVGRSGEVAGRWRSAVTPDDPELLTAIERELAQS